jgi:DNA recombination protein RmuC
MTTTLLIILSVFALITLSLAIFLYTRLQHSRFSAISTQQQLTQKTDYAAQLQSQADQLRQEQRDLQERLEEHLQAATESVTRAENLREQNALLAADIAKTHRLYEEAKQARHEAEKHAQLAEERTHAIQKRMDDWEKAQAASIQHAKAAIFEIGSQLSVKLIEDHKRETQESKKESQEAVDETTNKLHEQYESLVKFIGSLETKVNDSVETSDIVRRALLSPTGAGGLAEITLENIFKASGLTAGRDYVMQYSIADSGDGRLRPDAVVFLPAGKIMVVDSKASKFFLELAEATQEGREKDIYDRMKITIRNHLKSLSGKDYKEAIRAQLHKQRTDSAITHISTIMFLPSESALEKIHIADPEFQQKAWEADILPLGPSGIVNFLHHIRFQISEEREVRKLLAGMSVMYEHARKIGNGLQTAATNYDKFAGSFNSTLLPKARTIQKLGINLPQNKNLPPALERYQFIQTQNITLIEGEMEETVAEPEVRQLSN